VRVQFFAISPASLALTALTCLPTASAAQPARPTVLVMFQNEVNAPSELVDRASKEAARLFNLIDIDIVWVTEVPANTRLRVVSLTNWEPDERKVQPSVLGYTQIAQGKRGIRAYVFWRRVERASQKFTASLDKVLAIAIAHELGHMLLPNGKHAKTGLMRAPWDANHFRSASAGLLAFSPDCAALIQREMAKERSTTLAAVPRK
jgi:hypothetical protein